MLVTQKISVAQFFLDTIFFVKLNMLRNVEAAKICPGVIYCKL